jgi:anti-sigma factor RsiW
MMRIEAAVRGAPPIRRRFIWHTYPRLAPAAAAAVLLVVVLGAARGHRSPLVMEQALRAYHAAMPMDVVDSDCASIVNWFRGKVDFTVPSQLRPLGTCQGGRLVNVQDRFGAYIIYQVPGGHRLTVMVFTGDEEDLEAPDRRTMADGRSVYFQRGRGASTAAFRNNDGLNYVVTSDVDEVALGNLVQAVLTDRP